MLTLSTVLLATAFAAHLSSPAAQALARGEIEGALRLPASSPREASYLQARVALAHHEPARAEKLKATLPAGSPEATELEWHLARAAGDRPRIARAAAALCAHGDPTGRSCADAELHARALPARQLLLPGPRVEVPLARGVPVPLVLGQAGERSVGFVIDTGASETVISTSLARELGLELTQAAFPVGVAAGGGRAAAHLAIVPELRLGSAVVRALPVMVIDLPELERLNIHAILSPQQAFAGASVTLDFGRDLLTLAAEAPATPPGARTVKVPYLLAGFDLAVLARVGDGPPALFGVDTGMPSAYSLSGDYPCSALAAPAIPLAGAGGKAVGSLVAARPVELGGLVLTPTAEAVRTEMAGGRAVGLAGLLGNGLWKRGVLTLDTTGQTLTLSLPARS